MRKPPKKTVTLTIRVSKLEARMVAQDDRRHGLTRSAYIRWLVIAQEPLLDVTRPSAVVEVPTKAANYGT
jgi:hypothetical protein